MGLIFARESKHLEAINHGNSVIVPIVETKTKTLMNMRLDKGDSWLIQDIEQKWQFESYPMIEIREVDNLVEVKPFVISKKVLKEKPKSGVRK